MEYASLLRRRKAVVFLVLVLILLVPLAAPHPYLLALATQALVWVLLAASWDLLGGYAGLTSFGHAGFFALGAYAAAIGSKALGLPAEAGLALATVLTLAAGVIVGFPALRLRGHYLAIVTLAFAECVQLVATNWGSLTGGPFGIHDFGSFSGLPADPTARGRAPYLTVLAIAALALLALFFVCERTRAGRAFHAIREDEVLAGTLGIDTTVYKLAAFGLSAAAAGLAGGMHAYAIQLVVPSVGSAVTSATVIGMAVFGGLGTLWGPVLGALLLFSLGEALRFVGVVYNLIAIGLITMLFVIFFPRGIAGIVLRRPQRRLRADAGGPPLQAAGTSPGKGR